MRFIIITKGLISTMTVKKTFHTSASSLINRRNFLVSLSALAVSGCVSSTNGSRPAVNVTPQNTASVQPVVPAMYAALPEEDFPIPAVDIAKVPEKYWRTEVEYISDEKPGTIVVDTPNNYLYHVLPNQRATRYGIGVGRDGFSWAGRATMAYKRKWPRWTPPDEMVARQPQLEPYSIANGGMAPGLNNPLGARSHYIHKDGKDTLYRIHGTPEAWTIGKAVSSGCIRLLNQDIIHLYDNVRDGSPIVVIPDHRRGGQISA